MEEEISLLRSELLLLDVLPDLNVKPSESTCQLVPLVLLADSDDRPIRSSSVESLVLSDLNDEPRNPTVVSLNLFPDINNEQTYSGDIVDFNHEQKNPSLVTLDLFPSSKEDDKEEDSTKQTLGNTTTTPAPCPLENNVVSSCSSTTTEVHEKTVPIAPITTPTPCLRSDNSFYDIMNIDHSPPHVPCNSIKRKPMDIDYSSHNYPNPKPPKRVKRVPPYRRKPRKSFGPHPDEKCEKCGAAMDKTLCRNMKVSIMLTVKNIPQKEAGSLGDIEELAEEFMQQLDMRMKENSQLAGMQRNHLLSESQHVVLIE